MAAGLLPLVVPGLVLGILGLRRAEPHRPGRLAYWTAIGLSMAWAAVIAALVAGATGSPAGVCVGYPASVRAAYTKVMADFSGNASASVQAADLAAAARQANSAAAATDQIPVRSALFGMASDMQQIQAVVVADRTVSAGLLRRLKSDGTAFPHTCPG